MVYTAGARLTIQQIEPSGTLHVGSRPRITWTGTGASNRRSSTLACMAEGPRMAPAPYGAEVNVGGKIVYGYVWKTRI